MIKLAPPNLIGHAMQYVAQAINQNYIGPGGPFVEKFEYMVAEKAGYRYAVATSSCSLALLAAFTVLGFSGKTVKVTKASYPAARHALQLIGCETEFWDDEDGIFGYSHDSANYYPEGSLAFYPEVDDCAPSIGAYQSDSSVACYSFAANKTVTCGAGGALCTNDERLAEAVRAFISNGDTNSTEGRMPNINAAIGCAQMELLDQFLTTKRAIWNRYADAGLDMIERGRSRWMSSIWLKGRWIDNYAVGKRLDNAAIEYRLEFHDPDPYEDRACISLPCGTALTTAEQDKVIEVMTS